MQAAQNLEQEVTRRDYIGGSDAAGVLGLSRWATPLSVWAEKTGQIQPEDISGKLYVKLGHKLEPAVAELFMEETGKKVHRVNETIFHPQYPFLAANIDRRIVGEDALLECKTASAFKAKEWDGEEIPREYIIQCHHYLAVTGKKRCYLAVLIGNQDFQVKIIDRDEKLITDLVRREVSFWMQYVVSGVMPEVVSRHDADALDKLFPQGDQGKRIQLSDEANQIIEMLDGLKADLKNVQGLIELEENRLKQMLGNAVEGSTGLHKVYWGNCSRRSVDVRALAEEMPEIHAKYFRPISFRRFTTRPINKKEI